MNPVRVFIQPVGRALLLTGAVSGMLLMAGHSPAGEGHAPSVSGVMVERATQEWASSALPSEQVSGVVEMAAPVQRWVF